MEILKKVSNSDIIFRLNLNYNNVYARLRMLLGPEVSLFADIKSRSKDTVWFVSDGLSYLPVSEAEQNEKEVIANLIDSTMKQIKMKLADNHELEPYLTDILEVPSEDYIYYAKGESGAVRIVLTAWGCRAAHVVSDKSTGSIASFIENTLSSSQPVVLKAVDAVDNPLKGILSCDYNNEHFQFEVDEKGEKQLGILPNGTTFYITEIFSGEKQAFTVVEGCNMYLFKTQQGQNSSFVDIPEQKDENIVNALSLKEEEPQPKKEEPVQESGKGDLKKMQKVIVRVSNLRGNFEGGKTLSVSIDGGGHTFCTDMDGMADIGELRPGQSFTVSFPDVPSLSPRLFEVELGKQYYDMYFRKVVQYSPVVVVEDKEGNIVPNRDIRIVISGKDTMFNSGENGMIQLSALNEGQQFVVVDTYNNANSKEFTINSDNASQPYYFQVEKKKDKKINIRLIDKKGLPISNALINFNIGENDCFQVTDNKGRAEFPFKLFYAGGMPMEISIPEKQMKKLKFDYVPGQFDYTLKMKDRSFFPWKWVMLPFIFLLLAGGVYWFWNENFARPSLEELKRGIVLIKSESVYYVETGLVTDNKPLRLYFNYNSNAREISDLTFGEDGKIPFNRGTGTGFFISEDGEIATNRHIADPIPPKEAVGKFKKVLTDAMSEEKKEAAKIQNLLNQLGTLKLMDEETKRYDKLLEELTEHQAHIDAYERMLNLGTFETKVECEVGVSFYNSIIDSWDDFHECVTKISGEPGDVNSNDVAIIQLKEKARDMPKDAYIYKIPEKDPLDGKSTEDYPVIVLGYNRGITLANITEGIEPQKTDGKISSSNSRYQIMYTNPTQGGSSGSPVLNERYELVAVNNSGWADTQGFNYGVRIKYLKKLYDELHK